MSEFAVNENICNELRRISNRLTRIALVLETFLVASFPKDKSLVQTVNDMRSNLEDAEKFNP